MDYYDYNNRGSPRMLTSFGLMLASGFGALSRFLYGYCGPRQDEGYMRKDNRIMRSDNGYTRPDNVYMRPDNGYAPQYGGGRPRDADSGLSWIQNKDGSSYWIRDGVRLNSDQNDVISSDWNQDNGSGYYWNPNGGCNSCRSRNEGYTPRDDDYTRRY